MKQESNEVAAAKRFRLINLNNRALIFLAVMLTVLMVMYFTLSYELTVAASIVFGVIYTYERVRKVVLWIIAKIASIAKSLAKAVKRAIHVFGMDDSEFDSRFLVGKKRSEQNGTEERAFSPEMQEKKGTAEAVDEQSAEDSEGASTEDSEEQVACSGSAALIPEHAKIIPMTPAQAAIKALTWWKEYSIDGSNGEERLNILFERLAADFPQTTSFNIQEYQKELNLPQDFAVKQAVASILCENGYDASAEEDAGALFVMKQAEKDVEEVEQEPSNNGDATESGEEAVGQSAGQMKEISFLFVTPGQAPRVMLLHNTRPEDVMTLLGAETVHAIPSKDPVAIIQCTDTPNSAQTNRVVSAAAGQFMVISGAFIVTGWDDGIVSLSDELLDKYTKVFSVEPS